MRISLSKLKAARMGKGLSQRQLAKAVGVSGAVLSRYEVGTARPSLVTLQRLSYVLDVSLDELAKDYPIQSGEVDNNGQKIHCAAGSR